MIAANAYDRHVEQLFEHLQRLKACLDAAGVEYRIIGGLGVFFQVSAVDPDLARTTRDIDVAVRRSDISRITASAERFGLQYRHAAGVDMLLDAKEARARSAIHFVFVGEKVRPEYVDAVPEFSPATRTVEGILIASVADLVRMKLTSFRFKDRAHIVDLDTVGLITPAIERELPEALRERLRQVRAEEPQSTGAE